MRSTFVRCLTEKAEIDDRIFLLTPDMGYSVLEIFRDKFPSRFCNTGIAEQNTIGIASGLALLGKVVYVYSIIPFVTMRCFEQIRVDVAYMNTNVRIIGVGAGLSYGPAGATHHSIEDISIIRSLPNFTVCCPGDPLEVKRIINQSINHKGPMYIRLAKNNEINIHNENDKIEIGKASLVKEGKDFVLITTSNMLEIGNKWCVEWESEGINATLISMHTIKPLDTDIIKAVINNNTPIITLEEHNIIGGLGSAVSEVIAESGVAVKFKRIAINDEYTHLIGSQNYLRNKLGLIQKPDLNKIFLKN